MSSASSIPMNALQGAQVTNTDKVMINRRLPFDPSFHKMTDVFMQLGWRNPEQHMEVAKLLMKNIKNRGA